MTNKVELLRTICYTKEDFDNIKNLGDLFSEKEIEFMVEFKKIYELGNTQLEKFINKLDEEGKDLDTYTILYYVETLLSGPLGVKTRELSKDKKYFLNLPDSMGMLGNLTLSPSNTTIYKDALYQLGCSVDLYNKLPSVCQEILSTSIKETENMFRESMYSSSYIDNTLPTIDKQNNTKYDEEKKGTWSNKANGTYLNKDSAFYYTTEKISNRIFEKVKKYLGDENFRIYNDKKTYNPFSDDNESTSINSEIEKEFIDPIDDTIKETIVLDLFGDEFDTEEKRSRVLKISGSEKDEEFKLHTNEGQLGN